MSRKKLPYAEGDWIAVPLRDGGYAVGRLARVNNKGGLVAYFFGPRHQELPTVSELDALVPGDAVLVARLGDLGLLKGHWPVLGQSRLWERSQWCVPAFGRYEGLSGRSLKVEYDDNDPMVLTHETGISDQERATLPQDGLFGAGAVERVLTCLLPSGFSGPRARSDDSDGLE